MIDTFEQLVDEALSKASNIDIYTFAIYHDHESGFVSVCIDTKKNSEQRLEDSNKYSMKHFRRTIDEGNLDEAVLWQANIGRNLSLGDFEAVNIAEREIGETSIDDVFYLSIVKALQNEARKILRQSTFGSSLLFCCSTAEEEVGLTWVQENA